MILRVALVLGFYITFLPALMSMIEITRTAYKDPYKYYFLEKTKKLDYSEVAYKCLGPDTLWFGKIEINCANSLVRDVGQSPISVKKIVYTTSEPWYTPRVSSFQADIMNFICHQE